MYVECKKKIAGVFLLVFEEGNEMSQSLKCSAFFGILDPGSCGGYFHFHYCSVDLTAVPLY